MRYLQGEYWQDRCDYNCTCADAAANYYRCRPLCPSYAQLPAICSLVTVAGQCCPQLNCPGGLPNPLEHIIYLNATKYCYYKGSHYVQDATWNDGCDQACTCTNATRGMYTCGSVCLMWDSLPSICHLNDPPPGQCCKQPQCPSGVIINIPLAYKKEYPKTLNKNYNYVT